MHVEYFVIIKHKKIHNLKIKNEVNFQFSEDTLELTYSVCMYN
jgi:hypothetical protein